MGLGLMFARSSDKCFAHRNGCVPGRCFQLNLMHGLLFIHYTGLMVDGLLVNGTEKFYNKLFTESLSGSQGWSGSSTYHPIVWFEGW